MTMTAGDRKRISGAIRDAEAKTSGEIVCVLARGSSDLTVAPVLIAAVASLALPWLLIATTVLTVQRILSLQVALFVMLAVVLSIPKIHTCFVPRRLSRALAHRVALQQFMIRGVSRTRDRSGILIFVSLAERYARIVADKGISDRVSQSEWQDAVDVLVSHMRDGQIAEGFEAAVRLCGEKLSRHFPLTGVAHDELPDRLYVI